MSGLNSIAIDGPVASGKTAVGRLLARRLGFRFLDTGAMYRAVTWAAIRRGTDLDDERALGALAASLEIRLTGSDTGARLLVDGEDITDRLRDPEVDRAVSQVSAVSGVRSAMVGQQQGVAREGPIVMVGRDIGTVVLPDAGVKVFLKASARVRARRRYLELSAQGRSPDLQTVEDGLMRRDKIDTERADSPLRPAADAIELDTDSLDVEQVIEKILSIVGLG